MFLNWVTVLQIIVFTCLFQYIPAQRLQVFGFDQM